MSKPEIHAFAAPCRKESATAPGAAGRQAGVLAVVLCLGAAPMAAQDEDEDERAGGGFVLEEVIVTADRKEQSILDVPISVTAFDSNMLEDYQITNRKDLEVRVPGLQFGLDSPATIRGMGSLYRGLAGDVAVAQYSNDLYFDESYGVLSSMYDLERVEVLRGPQGTLYGRNSIGGAINYVNKRPEWEFGAGALAEVASYNGRRVNGFVTGPINDEFAFRLTGEWQETDGQQKNISGPDLGAKGDYNIAPQLAFRNERWDVNVRYSTFEQDARAARSACRSATRARTSNSIPIPSTARRAASGTGTTGTRGPNRRPPRAATSGTGWT